MDNIGIDQLIDKYNKLSSSIHVNIRKIPFSKCKNWIIDDRGIIRNSAGTFFTISGVFSDTYCQPIMIQNEIGYIGIIRKKIDGQLKYLMQYKIEPGNINTIQISPTIQGTKSNFTQQHGGRKPAYLEYFLEASKYKIVVDQLQSEQSSRFWGKRNRNIVIELSENDEIEMLSSYEWMTLDQLKKLMRIDNLVNMDTRTVLSCIPYENDGFCQKDFNDLSLYNSMFVGSNENYLPRIFCYINDYKMFHLDNRKLVPLNNLEGWNFSNDLMSLSFHKPYNFKVIFCDIEIEGREVRDWCQPLFEATGEALFGLFTCIENGVRLFLIRCKPEIGCFDQIEIGPSVQHEFISNEIITDVDKLFLEKLSSKGDSILFDTMLSEEGGRFYHEQNRNVIIQINKNDIKLPPGYFWVDYRTLSSLIRVNNVLNIQLRNLMSVLEF